MFDEKNEANEQTVTGNANSGRQNHRQSTKVLDKQMCLNFSHLTAWQGDWSTPTSRKRILNTSLMAKQ